MTDPYATPAAPLHSATTSPYMAVSRRKLTIMMIGTCGMYSIYWAYRQWKAYVLTHGGTQWPWARGLFWALFAYNLFEKLDAELRQRGHSVNWSPGYRGLIMLGTYLVTSVLTLFLAPLYGTPVMVIALALYTFVLRGTLPAVNRLADDVQGRANSRLSWANAGWLALGLLAWASTLFLAALPLLYPELQY